MLPRLLDHAGLSSADDSLTKAELADLLFEVVGLNKREAKEVVDIFFEEIRRLWSPARASSYRASETSSCVISRSGLAATPRPEKRSRLLPDAW